MLLCCIFCLLLLIWSCIWKVENKQVIHVQTALITIRRPPSPALKKESLTKQEHLDIAWAVWVYLLNKLIYHLIVSKQFHILNVSRAKAEHSTCLMTDSKPHYAESRDGMRSSTAALKQYPQRAFCIGMDGQETWKGKQQMARKLRANEGKPNYGFKNSALFN